jgi:hypothetical protein
MRLKPENAGRRNWINAGLRPPCRLVAITVDLAMMTTAERYREFVAHLAAKRSVLRETQVMRIGGRATANQTWLFCDEPYMFAIANAARFSVAEFALVDARGVGPSGELTRFDFAASADLVGTLELRELLLERIFDLLGIARQHCTLGSKHPMCPGRGDFSGAYVPEFTSEPFTESRRGVAVQHGWKRVRARSYVTLGGVAIAPPLRRSLAMRAVCATIFGSSERIYT